MKLVFLTKRDDSKKIETLFKKYQRCIRSDKVNDEDVREDLYVSSVTHKMNPNTQNLVGCHNKH
jgi:hypothetical protein